MRRLWVVLLLLVPAGAQAQGLGSGPGIWSSGPSPQLTSTGWLFGSTTGAEMAPAIAAANYTGGAGWDLSVAGTANKNADGTGTLVPNPALTVVAGTTYRVSITVGAVTVGSGATYTLGGAKGTPLSAAATYVDYVTAASTANLTITPTPTGTRFTITAISVQAVTPSADVEVRGQVTARGPIIVSPSTDPSNYERGALRWTATGFTLGTESAGSGGTRTIVLDASNNLVLSDPIASLSSDTQPFGQTTNFWTTGYFSRGFQGSKSKSLTDAGAAVTIERVAVPTNGYANAFTFFAANSTDGTNRLTTWGIVTWGAADTAGNVTCGAPTVIGLGTAYKRANTLLCTFSTATATTNCDLQVTCTDNLAGTQTMAIEHFPIAPTVNAYTPQ